MASAEYAVQQDCKPLRPPFRYFSEETRKAGSFLRFRMVLGVADCATPAGMRLPHENSASGGAERQPRYAPLEKAAL